MRLVSTSLHLGGNWVKSDAIYHSEKFILVEKSAMISLRDDWGISISAPPARLCSDSSLIGDYPAIAKPFYPNFFASPAE